MKTSAALRYFHTLRHLKPRQVAFRLIRRLMGPSLPRRRGPVTRRSGVHLKPVVPRSMSLAHEFAFRFLNEERCFPPCAIDWRVPAASKLWRYNLHYFDYLHDPGRTARSKEHLIEDWIKRNPPASPDAWEPFPLSLRMVNWIKYFVASGSRASISHEWLESLHDQALWLEQSVEYHLLGNHLFKNGKALLFAGVYFAGDDAARWLRKGANIISRELVEQVLPDGGHFERSPMYHAMILEDCLDLYNLTRERPERDVRLLAERLRGAIPRMLRFALGMAHPDGDIALFNDAAFGIEPRPHDLASYWERLTGNRAALPAATSFEFPETGYFVMAPEAGNRLIIDCGPVGPDYQPGHSHCDTLSFELSLQGKRVVVDSGCGQYPDGDIRRYNRGNMGHNTLTIDGLNQSEVWGAHRCARRAKPLEACLEKFPDATLSFRGAHDGYRHLPGQPIHRRTVTWLDKEIAVGDEVEGRGCHDIELRLHINPELTVEVVDEKAVLCTGGFPVATIAPVGSGRIEITDGLYCPEFGRVLTAQVLVVSHNAVSLPFHCGWNILLP